MDGSQTALLLFGVTALVVLVVVSRVTGRSGARRRHDGGSDASSSGVLPVAGGDGSPGVHGGGHTGHHAGHDGGSWGGGGSFDSGSGTGGSDSGGGGGDSGGGGGGGD